MNRLRSELAVAAALAIVGGTAAWIIGVSGLQSALLGVAVLTASAGFAWVPSRNVTWPARRPPRPYGTRTEVARLSWVMIGRKGSVTAPAMRRLLALAQRRLAGCGVELDNPRDAAAAERLLGTRAYRVLRAVADDPARPVRYSTFVRFVAAVEQLQHQPRSGSVADPPSAPEAR